MQYDFSVQLYQQAINLSLRSPGHLPAKQTNLFNIAVVNNYSKFLTTRMWADAQRDGHPGKYRWCPLFNVAKFGWHPLLECHAVTEPISATRGPSSPYCEDVWRRYCCFISIFPIVGMCLSCEDIAWQSCAMVPGWRIFGYFLGHAFPVRRVQRTSDLHSKFALRPHQV